MTARKRYRGVVFDSARWDGFELRAGDVIIATPAKCGTTWMQKICALLIFDGADLGRPLSEVSPWLDMLTSDIATVVTLLDAQQHRRFIKTHTPLDGLPWDERVTYLVVGRDPRDVSQSWVHHMNTLDRAAFLAARAAAVGLDDLAGTEPPPPPPDDPRERFWMWAESDADGDYTLAVLLHNLSIAWERRHLPNVALFHYSDLQADLVGEMERVAAVLGLPLGRARIEELAKEATFDAMKARADEVVPERAVKLWADSSQFFHKGSSGQWHDLLDHDGIARYEARVAELVPPDLARWAHVGWRGMEADTATIG